MLPGCRSGWQVLNRRANLTEQLRAVQADIAKRIHNNERLRLEQHQFTEQARVAGRIAYYLENSSAVPRKAICRAN
jgi:hypothetical protein